MININANIIGRQSGGDNAPTQQVSNLIVTDISDESMSLSWTKKGSSTIILVSESPIVDSPLDGTTYSVGEVIGDSVVGYVGSAGSADISNLTPETEYFFRAIAHNGSKYNTDTGDNEITEKTFCTEFQNVLDYAISTSRPHPALYAKRLISQFIIDLKDLGAYQEWDLLYITALNDSTKELFARINYINPGQRLLIYGSGTTAGVTYGLEGYDISGGDTTVFMRPGGWAPSDGVKYSDTNAGFGFYIFKNAGFIMGANNASGANRIRYRKQTNMTYNVNGGGGTWSLPPSTIGWHHARRTSNTDLACYLNGTQVDTDSQSVESRASIPINLGTINNNGPSNTSDGFNFSILYFGSSLSSVNMTALNEKIAQFIKDILTPEVQASNLEASNYGENTLTISVVPGSGIERLLVGKKGSPVDAVPSDGTSYTANATFGSGDELGTGNFVLAKSSGSTFNIELPEYDDYYFRVFEIGAGNVYNTDTADGNPFHVEFFDFEVGELDTLHSDESYEQIKARRLLNWDKFKTRALVAIENNAPMVLPDDTLEIFFPGTPITIDDTETLEITGGEDTSVFIFPFAFRDATESVFELNTGAEIILDTIKFRSPSRRKFEVYPCVLKKNGNSKLIEVLGEVRPGFWNNLAVNKRIRYNWEFEANGVNNATIASWDADAKTITLNQNISSSVSDNMSGPWVNVCMLFEESVPLADFDTYGDYWFDSAGGVSDEPGIGLIHHAKNETGNDTIIDLRDTELININRAIDVSSRTCKIKFSGTCKLYGAASVCLNHFTFDGVGTNEIIIEENSELIVQNNGSLIKGGNNTADNILGSGGYIAPNVKITCNGKLTASDNLALAWRQFSGSLDQKTINENDETYYKLVEITGSGEGRQMITSNSMPVSIDEAYVSWIRCGGSVHLKGGVVELINGNTQQQPDVGTPITIQIDDTEVGQINFGYSSDRMPYLTVTLNRVTFKARSASNNSHIVASTSSLDNLSLNDCQFILNAAEGVDPYTPGTIPDNSKSSWNILGGARMKSVTISGLLTEAYMSILLGTTVNDRVGNELVIDISDSEINTPQLMNTVTQSQARSGMFHMVNTIIHSNLFNRYAGACYGFKIEPIENEDDTPREILESANVLVCFPGILENTRVVPGVLFVEFTSNHYHVNSGTLKHISPWLWGRNVANGTAGKVTHANCWEGDLLITAVGGDITFEKFDGDTNPLGNIENDFVLPQGQTAKCTCNRYRIFSTGGHVESQSTLATGNGTDKVFSGISSRITKQDDFSITCGDITITFDQDGYGSGSGVDFAYYDFFGGRWYIEFTDAVGNGTPIVMNYRTLGTWRNTGAWTISLVQE
jgi:hypothetical protein